MAEMHEVLLRINVRTDTPLEQVQNNDEKNVFANERQHSEKHAAEVCNERDALANLIANLTHDTEEEQNRIKQLKKGKRSQCLKNWKDQTNLYELVGLREATIIGILSDLHFRPNRSELENTTSLTDRTRDYKILQNKADIGFVQELKTENHDYLEIQCLIYPRRCKEWKCLAQKLSKQTESVNNEVHNKLLKSFAKLEKHSISLELSLQHCKEQMKNNTVCKEKASNVFRKEREQYHEIQDLKAQMQDKNIAISELKKLIENCKGKSVETQFDKPSVVRQPNAQRIPKPSVLGKPTPFSNSPEMRSFQTKQSVNKTNVSDGLFKQVTQQNLPQIRKQAVRNTNVIAPGPSRNCPKHVSHQSPREKVGSNDMVHNYYLEKAKKSAQLQKDKEVNGKPSMIDPARLPNTANGCKPKPRNWQASMSSRVSNKDVHLGEHRKQKPFLKFNELQCPTCKKCLYSANHDECVLEYLSRLNPRASAQNKDAKSHKTTKRYMPVEKSSASKKPERQIPTGHRFSNKKTTTVPEKTMNPRSCLRWKPTGRIFSNVRLRWIPTGKLLNSCTGKVDSEPAHGSIVDIPHIHACKQTLGLSAGTSFNGQKQQRIDINADALYNEKQENLRVWLLKFLISKKPVPEWPRSSMFKRRLIAADQASVFMAMMSVHISSGLVLHQMTSDHNRSELRIQDHSNEQSSSKLVPKVVPLAVKTTTSRQELELLFHLHIAMLRTTDGKFPGLVAKPSTKQAPWSGGGLARFTILESNLGGANMDIGILVFPVKWKIIVGLRI
ncbi:hypothetical protein Tco_0276076 [Tanacetum coccineum]